jgi:chromosome segregation ATPase
MLVEFLRWLLSKINGHRPSAAAEFREDFRLLKEAYVEVTKQNQLLATQLTQRLQLVEERLARTESELETEKAKHNESRKRLDKALRESDKYKEIIAKHEAELITLRMRVSDLDQRSTNHGNHME